MFAFVRNRISKVLVIDWSRTLELFFLLQLCEVRPLAVADGYLVYFVAINIRRWSLVSDR